jgi:ATP-dependent DNA ligase
VKSAYLDGELCALNSEGVPVFSRLQSAMDEGRMDQLVFFAFDLLYLNGESTSQLPLIRRKERLQRLPRMPLAEAPPRDSRFGSPLQLSRVHWVRPAVVVEVTYLTWTEDNLLRQVSYQGQREDKPAKQVVRRVPHPPQRPR